MKMIVKIKMLMAMRDVTQTELAERIGMTQGNLSRKFSNNTLTEKDLNKIAEALNCEFVGNFKTKDTGEII